MPDVLFALISITLSLITLAQGLPGLRSRELFVAKKYGGGTRYLGNKAVVMSLGLVVLGLCFMLTGVVTVLGLSFSSSLTVLIFISGFVSYFLAWFVSRFVSGSVLREPVSS